MPRTRPLLCLSVSAIAAIVHLIIAIGASRHIETAWDEAVDRRIAIGLRDHPLVGEQPVLDASQTRLPMYATAVLFRITGRDDVAVARVASCMAGAACVFVTGLLGGMLFGGGVGAVAAILLSLSPYFISFSRIAMTEGDVFFALAMTLSITAFVAYLRRPSMPRCVLTAIFTAGAIGAKFHGIVLLLTFAVVLHFSRTGIAFTTRASVWRVRRFQSLLAIGWVITALTLLMAHFSTSWAIACWVLLLLTWLYTVFYGLANETIDARPWPALMGLLALAGLSFFALMPVHVLQPAILRELARRIISWDHRVPLALAVDHLRLYSGLTLFKLTLPLGIIALVGIAWAALRERDEPKWRPAILTIIWFVIALCFLPLRQTFYLMGVYPLIMIITAGMLDQIASWARGYSKQMKTAWMVVAAVLLGHYAWRVRAAYPDFQLYGYATVGDRWLGAPTLGYRNIIQTPSDGVESLIAWCKQNVQPGQRVVSYLWEDHIIAPLIADAKFEFIRRGLSDESDTLPDPPPIDDADYVLVHINNKLGYGDLPPDMPDAQTFADLFKPVFTFRRSGLEMAWVYERIEPRPTVMPSRTRK